MKLPKPYIAVMFNWNKEKLSTDIIYLYLGGKEKRFVAHTRLNFTYEKDYLRVYRGAGVSFRKILQ